MLSTMIRAQQTGPPARLVLPEETIGAEQILSLTYSAGCAAETTAPSIGSAVAATVALELAGELPKLEGKSVRLDVGVPDDAGGTVWRSLGHFRFETPQTGEGKTTVTAVDAMLWALEQGYYPSSAAGSTALSILQDICTQAGVTLASTAGITDVAVSGTLEGYTMRELAGYLAALLGRNALFDADGKLALRWFAASSLTVTTDDYYAGGFTRKDEAWTLAGLAVTTGSGEDDTLTAGATAGTVLRFSNPFMTQSILDGIWSRISGFSFRPGEVNLLGDLRVEPGDLVTVTDLAGDSYTLAVMAVEQQYDGGWKTKLSAYGSAEGDTSAGYQGPTVTAMERYAAEFGSFRQLYAQDLTATNATLANLTAAQANISSLIATKADIEDLTAALARIDELEAGKITVDWLDATFVRAEDILADNMTAAEGNFTHWLTGVNLLATNIKGGTIDAGEIEVVNLNCANLTVGTINGQQIASGAIDESKLSDALAGTLNQTAADVEQALTEAGLLQGSVEALEEEVAAALTTANGKSTAYYQASAPSGGSYSQDDLWFETDNGYRMYRYIAGLGWQAAEFGSGAIAANAITASELAASAVTAGKIAAGAVTTDKLAASAVTAAKIDAGAVTASKIAAGAISANHLAANSVTADAIAAGVIQTEHLAVGTVTTDRLAAQAVTADKINVTDLFAQDITATGKISGLELEGATGSFSGHIAATTGSIAGFTLDGGSMYCHDTYVSSANTEESVTLWFHGIPSQSERGTGSPNLTYEGAWAGNPNSVAASLRVDLEEAPSGGGASGFDRILLEMSRLTDGQRGALAVTVSGCEVTGNCAVSGNGSFSGSLSTYGCTVPRIQHGNISVTVTAGSSTNFTISFPKSFPGTPDVVITPRHNSTGANYELTVRLRTVSASNATGVIYCGGGTATWVLHWVAMY